MGLQFAHGHGCLTQLSALFCAGRALLARRPLTPVCFQPDTAAPKAAVGAAAAGAADQAVVIPKLPTGPITGAPLMDLHKRFKKLQNGSDVRGIAIGGGCACMGDSARPATLMHALLLQLRRHCPHVYGCCSSGGCCCCCCMQCATPL